MKNAIKELYDVLDLDKFLENDKEYQKLKVDYKEMFKLFWEKVPYDLSDMYSEIIKKQQEIENYKCFVCFKKGFSNGVYTILESMREN